jgi:hypothetical protein
VPRPSLSWSKAVLSANARSIRSAPAAPIKKTPSALVFVRLARDRLFAGAVLFLFVFVLFVFIRISGRYRVAHDHHGTPVDHLVENSSGMCGVMLLLLGCDPRRFTPSAVIRHANLTPFRRGGGSLDRSEARDGALSWISCDITGVTSDYAARPHQRCGPLCGQKLSVEECPGWGS